MNEKLIKIIVENSRQLMFGNIGQRQREPLLDNSSAPKVSARFSKIVLREISRRTYPQHPLSEAMVTEVEYGLFPAESKSSDCDSCRLYFGCQDIHCAAYPYGDRQEPCKDWEEKG